jgi:hypothetical protein
MKRFAVREKYQRKQMERTGVLFLEAALFLHEPLACCIRPPLF